MTLEVIFEDKQKFDRSDLFVEEITFCKSKAEIKILLFSSELGTQSTQGYPVIVANFWLLGNDRKVQIYSAIVVEGYQASTVCLNALAQSPNLFFFFSPFL